MNQEQFKEQLFNKIKECDGKLSEIWIERYFKLVFLDNEKEGYRERHHILPASHFPEFEKEKWNIALISARKHYLVHWLLSKLLGGKQWFAFNNMKRILPKKGPKKSALYALSRQYVAEQVSKSNKGRRCPDHVRFLTSKQKRGMVCAKDALGQIHYVSTKDPRYLSGELVYYRVGYKHTEETKQKMRASGHEPGTMYHHCQNGKIRYFEIPPSEEWIKGCSDKDRIRFRNAVVGKIWYHDPNTKKDVRLAPNSEVPDHYIKGRKNGIGFRHINGKLKRAKRPNKKK